MSPSVSISLIVMSARHDLKLFAGPDAADASALAIEGVGMSEKFDQFISDDAVWKENVVAEVKRLQGIVKRVRQPSSLASLRHRVHLHLVVYP